jgi:hypothetical protein
MPCSKRSVSRLREPGRAGQVHVVTFMHPTRVPPGTAGDRSDVLDHLGEGSGACVSSSQPTHSTRRARYRVGRPCSKTETR